MTKSIFVNDYGRTDAFSTLAPPGQGDSGITPSSPGSKFQLSSGTESLEPSTNIDFVLDNGQQQDVTP